MTLGTGSLLLGAGDTGYNLTRSLRFRASASAYLNRTFTTPTNNQKWTWSGWVKRGNFAVTQNLIYLMGVVVPGGAEGVIRFSADTLMVYDFNGTGFNWQLQTNAVFRDPSAWYHVVVNYDSTQATASNRASLYVNGVQQTSFSTATYPTLNAAAFIPQAYPHYLASSGGTANFYDGYLAEVNFIDGQALTPASFGETNALTGVWQPKAYTGTYGTNGFYLPFTDNSALTTSSNVGLGKDFSGNGNYWTTNNISITAGVTYDSMTDVPTLTSATAANFAVLNPLNPARSTLTNGNLTASGTTDLPSIIPESGTWYFEINGVSKTWTPPAAFPAAAGDYNFGQRPFANTPTNQTLNTFNLPTATILKGNTVMDATLYTGNGSTQTITNAAGFKPDLVWVKQRNGTFANYVFDSNRGVTKRIVTNTTAIEDMASGVTSFNSNGFTLGSDTGENNSGSTFVGWQWQAGQGTTSTNTSGSITSTVSVNASAGFSIVTYTGTGANATVGHGLGVAPSLIIIKDRNTAGRDWAVWHSSFSGTQYVLLNSTSAIGTNGTVWNSTTPTSSVFSIGTNALTNGSTETYVAYCWSEIAGFSKFSTFIGNGSSDGTFVYCGFRPKYILSKRTDSTGGDWAVLDSARDTYNLATSTLYPDLSNAENTGVQIDIVSNGFKCRNTGNNTSGATYLYYAFAENPFRYSLAR